MMGLGWGGGDGGGGADGACGSGAADDMVRRAGGPRYVADRSLAVGLRPRRTSLRGPLSLVRNRARPMRCDGRQDEAEGAARHFYSGRLSRAVEVGRAGGRNTDGSNRLCVRGLGLSVPRSPVSCNEDCESTKAASTCDVFIVAFAKKRVRRVRDAQAPPSSSSSAPARRRRPPPFRRPRPPPPPRQSLDAIAAAPPLPACCSNLSPSVRLLSSAPSSVSIG